MIFGILAASTTTVEKANIGLLVTTKVKAAEFVGGLLAGGVILVIDGFLSSIAHDHISKRNPTLSNMTKLAIAGVDDEHRTVCNKTEKNRQYAVWIYFFKKLL